MLSSIRGGLAMYKYKYDSYLTCLYVCGPRAAELRREFSLFRAGFLGDVVFENKLGEKLDGRNNKRMIICLKNEIFRAHMVTKWKSNQLKILITCIFILISTKNCIYIQMQNSNMKDDTYMSTDQLIIEGI